MNPLFSAIRAIGVEFARRIYQPITITVGIIAILLIALSLWLVTISDWWWILFAIILIATFVVTGVLVAIGLLLHAIRPQQSKAQVTNIKQFVDKIQNLTDVAGTPKFVILFYIVRDVVGKNKNGYIKRISSETLSMQHDFRDITDSFK